MPHNYYVRGVRQNHVTVLNGESSSLPHLEAKGVELTFHPPDSFNYAFFKKILALARTFHVRFGGFYQGYFC